MAGRSTISPQKLTRLKKLAAEGHSKSSIAKLTGLGHGTIDKYVSIDEAQSLSIKSFKGNLSSLLHQSLLSGMQIQQKLLDSLNDEDIGDLSISDKRQLIRDLSVVNGTIYDKIRLQDGKSTVNSSHQIQLTAVHDSMQFSPISSMPSGNTTKADQLGNSEVIDNKEVIDCT
jgi:predicted transcriptional regulator